MTTITKTVTLPYVQAPETSADLDWADLATLDLSKFDQPGGKQELAADLARALEGIGRFTSIQTCSYPRLLPHDPQIKQIPDEKSRLLLRLQPWP